MEKGEKKGEKGRKYFERRNIIMYIIVLTHHESGDITFPGCLWGREITMIPPKICKVTYGEEKSDI